ncbi:RHS repeat domain-containing protein [Pseudidiomarina halophila]|uniref:RHS repeat domain-containing protein n=1 Tax=Pseudidiomarina halophila TaxID=1449799 RepID=UPI0018E5203E|nr:RHS repeat-associated core domain-containing protein [Pseudidiomarina halophila]
MKSYIWLEGELVALVYNDDLYFVHNDHLGRPHKVTDDAKAVVWEADLQSFDRSVVSSSIGALNIGFPGQYWDSESATWQNWYRDYDPSTGRYIQSDPIGLSGGMNTYSYVASNPMRFIDFKGLAKLCSRPLAGFERIHGPLRHDQFFYEDGSNSGFTTTGGLFDNGTYFSDEKDGYSCDSRDYEDSLLKTAERKAQKIFDGNRYNVLSNNCQDYVELVIRLYNNIEYDARFPIQ